VKNDPRTKRMQFIQAMQAWLICMEYGDEKLVAHGEWDKRTTRALTKFQKVEKIHEEQGKLNDVTLDCMSDDIGGPLDWRDAPLKMQQAALILAGYTAGGMLCADGVDGPHTKKAFAQMCKAAHTREEYKSIGELLEAYHEAHPIKLNQKLFDAADFEGLYR